VPHQTHITGDLRIRDVTEADLERVRVFLEAHLETSLFLLSNLAILGPRLGEHYNSGDFRLLEQQGQVVAVFCVTRRGTLLVQAGGRTELADDLLAACGPQPIPINGVIGEWPTSEAIWKRLQADPALQPRHTMRDVLYRLSLSNAPTSCAPARGPVPVPVPVLPGITVRALEPEDFPRWEPLNTAYLEELRLPVPNDPREREQEFVSRARARLWWGAFNDGRLLAIVGLNATYGALGQVGGVYTTPEKRGIGLSRAAMQALIEDSRDYHHFERLTLFTGEDNVAARRLYDSLGFEAVGAFGLYLGERSAVL
jgi:RimJ/RimL family protein N-acetyltransferase